MEQQINKLIKDFKSIKNPTTLDYMAKSQKISDIIYKDKEVNKTTKRLVDKYHKHLSDIDNRDEYLNYKKK